MVFNHKIICIILCMFFYTCAKKDNSCQTCIEIKSYKFDYIFLFPENFERTINYDNFCQHPDYTGTDIIAVKEKGKKWENSRIKTCINMEPKSMSDSPIEPFLDDLEKYLFESKKTKRKTFVRGKKIIKFVEYLDRESGVLTLITYYHDDTFLIRKKIKIQEFTIDDNNLIEQLLFA